MFVVRMFLTKNYFYLVFGNYYKISFDLGNIYM